MWRPLLLAALVLFVPGISRAQNIPERLLPAGSQIYLSWDGMEKHRAAYEKTAVGKMMKEDTGKFLGALWTYGNEILDLALRNADPNVTGLINQIPGIVAGVYQHGAVVGIELKSVKPPQGQAVLVFPKAGGDQGSIIPLIDKVTSLGKVKVKTTKVGKRKVQEIGDKQIHFGWWQEANGDVVLVVGTTPPAELAKNADSSRDSFAQSKHFAKLSADKQNPSCARAHLDLSSLAARIGEISPMVDKIIEDVGLKGAGAITMVSGFSGSAERSLVEWYGPETRKGLLSLMNRKTFTLDDLPPLPADATSFSASNFNMRNLYDGGLVIAEAVVNALGGAIDPKEAVRQAEAFVGVKFGEDLFGSFGDMLVSYSSPAEGPFGLGRVYVFKVKDEKKLAETLESLFKAIPPFPGVEISYQKKTYRGGELLEIKLKTFQGEFVAANMAVHKGWFIFAGYPQGVYGFILRSNGDLPKWKASAQLTKALSAFPKEFTGIAISDPRPTVTTLLSLAPAALTAANSFLPSVLPGAPMFDVSTIPHAQYAVRHLFPNITVTTDDGKKVRYETRGSLAMPF